MSHAFDSVIRVGIGRIDEMWVVATGIEEWGEVDSIFLEPADRIDDGCVALTQPMSYVEAIKTMYEIKAERDADHPNWLQDMYAMNRLYVREGYLS